jgi:hypothetical protein
MPDNSEASSGESRVSPRSQPSFVPEDFAVPRQLATNAFRLEPLGPEHNAADHHAWTSSIEHIRATPGDRGRRWPDLGMTLQQNLADLRRHAEDFASRAGFTYTVLAADSDEVMGCVYIYPSDSPAYDADVRSWVRADRAGQDAALRAAVRDWLARAWPFTAVSYAR